MKTRFSYHFSFSFHVVPPIHTFFGTSLRLVLSDRAGERTRRACRFGRRAQTFSHLLVPPRGLAKLGLPIVLSRRSIHAKAEALAKLGAVTTAEARCEILFILSKNIRVHPRPSGVKKMAGVAHTLCSMRSLRFNISAVKNSRNSRLNSQSHFPFRSHLSFTSQEIANSQ
jgi:hypothetical protein